MLSGMSTGMRMLLTFLLLGVGVWVFDKLTGGILGGLKRNLP